VSSDDTNPNSSEYIDAHCNDLSDGKWKRIILFVFDSRLVDSVECYEGDADACSRLGVDTTDTGSSGSAAASGGTLASGDFAWPVPEKYVQDDWDWFTKPHHDHPSSDIPVPEGTEVYSVTAGKVTYVCKGYCGGYGNVVAIDYKDGLFRYQHGLDGSIKVKVGDTVTPGQQIMTSDNTGFSTGAHLHVSIETGGSGASARTTEHCPQALWIAMKANDTKTLSEPFANLPTTGCVGGASLY
jgi:murein DD-endopeptidase MepM/ murein hydrolase activator NlpD